MSDDYACSERRNKSKDKARRNRRFPFKHGGSNRALGNKAVIKK
jgi:hypothetical protein